MSKLTKLIMFSFLVVIGCGVVLILVTSMPSNALGIPYTYKSTVYSIIPQGWAFFTRDAREDRILVYQLQNEDWILINDSSANPKNMMGLSRRSRRMNVEIGNMIETLKEKEWVECNSAFTQCIPDSGITITNKFENPLITGEFVFKLAEPVPWAWSTSTELVIPSRLIRIKVK